VNRSAKYATAIVVAHLLVNIVHGLAHRELRVGLAPLASIFGSFGQPRNDAASFSCRFRCSVHCYLVCTTIFWLLAQITSIRSLRVDGAPRLS
jgi:hypothetical protein